MAADEIAARSPARPDPTIITAWEIVSVNYQYRPHMRRIVLIDYNVYSLASLP